MLSDQKINILNTVLELTTYKKLILKVNKSIINNFTISIIAYDFRHPLHSYKVCHINGMTIFYPDSSGILFLLKIFYPQQAKKFKRLVSSDFHLELLSIAEKENYKLFLLGDTAATLQHFIKKIKFDYKNLKISGYADGYSDLAKPNLIKEINNSDSDILLIGLGTPKQEKWLWENSDKLDIPVRITVGAFFTFYSGRIDRAPLLVRKLYMEWFYRFILEPKRLFSRYFIQFPKVFLLIARKKWRR